MCFVFAYADATVIDSVPSVLLPIKGYKVNIIMQTCYELSYVSAPLVSLFRAVRGRMGLTLC